MKDAMLTVLYEKAFQTKVKAERLNATGSDDRERSVMIALNALLNDLIDIRTEQIKHD